MAINMGFWMILAMLESSKAWDISLVLNHCSIMFNIHDEWFTEHSTCWRKKTGTLPSRILCDTHSSLSAAVWKSFRMNAEKTLESQFTDVFWLETQICGWLNLIKTYIKSHKSGVQCSSLFVFWRQFWANIPHIRHGEVTSDRGYMASMPCRSPW